MRSPCVVSRHLHLFIALLIFCLLPCSQAVRAAVNASPIQLTGGPIEKASLIEALDNRALSREELIQILAARGVNFKLTTFVEQEIRNAGGYLGRQALDDVIKAVRGNFIQAQVRETLVLRRSAPQRVEYLGFKALYLGPVGSDFLIRVASPSAEEAELKTRHDCEYDLKWGNREFTLGVAEASPEQVTVVLSTKVKPASAPNAMGILPNAPATLPAEEVIRKSPCLPIRMRLVSEGRTLAGGSAPPFYISEPLTVGILRHYAGKHTPKTPIPTDAKDTDPITQIHREDALDIATMLGTQLPSYEQLLSASSAQVLTPAGDAELVTDGRGGLLAVQIPAGGSASSTPRLIIPKEKTDGPQKGFFRVVRVIRPGKIMRPVVTPNTTTSP